VPNAPEFRSFLAVFFKSWSASQGKKKVVPSPQNFLQEALFMHKSELEAMYTYAHQMSTEFIT
jgi:hypothetical protein